MEDYSLHISLAALFVSFASFGFAFYNGKIQKLLQFDQIRHSISMKLLSLALCLNETASSHIANEPDPASIEALKSLVSLTQVAQETYSKMSSFSLPWLVSIGPFAIEFNRLKNDIEEIEHLVDKILIHFAEGDWGAVSQEAELVKARFTN